MVQKIIVIMTALAALTACGGQSGDVSSEHEDAEIKIYFYGDQRTQYFRDTYQAFVNIDGNENTIRIQDTPRSVFVTGDGNVVRMPPGDVFIVNTGQGNDIQQGDLWD